MPEPDRPATPAAIGPRLRTAREHLGRTLADVSRATGIAPSTLSRVENGRRPPTLDLLLRLADAYDLSLDALTGRATTPPQRPPAPAPRAADGKTVLPLTPYRGGVHAHKHVLPPAPDPTPSPPHPSSHEGYQWLCVLSGRLRLALADTELQLTAGEVAEFDTRTPHALANASPDTPVEYLVVFGPQGERLRHRARPTPHAREHGGGPEPR